MSNPTELQGLAYDKDMDRHYIPLPGGWEIQTKGKGSTFRIAHAGSGRRWMVLDDQLHDPLVALANAVREALARRVQPEGEAPQADGLTRYSMWSNPVGHGMDPSPSGDWVSFDEVRDLLAAQYQGARCSTCDGTGMAHRADGEYLGECGCEDAASAPSATLSPLCGAQQAESGKEAAAAMRVIGAQRWSKEAEMTEGWLATLQTAAPEQFCDANCVWTDHHKDCTISAPGTPEAPQPPFPISDDEMAALRRFWECATDGEGYDVDKSMMQRLSEMGLVQRKSGAYYMATDFGLYVLGEYTIQRAAQLDGGQEGSAT